MQISDCNQLKKLDLTKNTNIKELRLNGNGNLTTVKLAKKNKIKLLCIIEAKKLKKINIESLTKVQDISATGVKKIKKLNLSKLQKLYDFEWTNGSLKKIIWGKKKGHFVRIIVKRNKLSGKINLKKFGGLFYFHCNHNNYKEIIGGKYLVSLNCDYNKNLRKVDMRICSELDGFSAVKEIRKNCNTPVIMLSARGEEYDKIHGFELGIDDYVVKPFSPKELMMRINAVIKRSSPQTQSNDKVEFEGLIIDYTARIVTVDGEKIDLSPKEYDLLFYMSENKNIALTREMLITNVWGYDFYGDDRTLDTHIKLLRKSLGKYSKFIVTLRGVGYRFEVE